MAGEAPDVQGNDSGSQSDTAETYNEQFTEMINRFMTWATQNGFDLATNLRDEVRRIMNRYSVDTNDYSALGKFEIPEPIGIYSLLFREDKFEKYFLMQVDPRAFDFVSLSIFAWDRGYRVSSALGGKHGEFSFHTDGRAIDVPTNGLSADQIDSMRRDFSRLGLRIYDETDKKNWTPDTTGFHLHVDTATTAEIIERKAASKAGLSRADLGLGTSWPLLQRTAPLTSSVGGGVGETRSQRVRGPIDPKP